MTSKLEALVDRARSIQVPIATKLVLSFLLIVAFISTVYMIVGVRLIGDRIVAEAQDKVRHDLNAARELYLGNLAHINDIVRVTADRFFLREALLSGNLEDAYHELQRVRIQEGLDVLTLTDQGGNVLLRTAFYDQGGDNQSHDEIIRNVLENEESAASTVIVSGEDLERESPLLRKKAYFEFIETPRARDRDEFEETAGMMLKAASPIFDSDDNVIGILYGGTLLNRNFEIVDKVKETVYEEVIYEGKDIGTVTIFQDDVRISTNVKNNEGSRALGTRVTEEVYDQVVNHGEPWIGRAYVVNDWYITAYEPIRDVANKIIGILYVGVLEEKYLDIRQGAVLTFLGITIAAALVALIVSYFMAQRILIPIFKLVNASKAVASGDLDATVEVNTNDELEYLADSFNAMALALKKRDTQLKEFATQKIMESEKLALIGQLAANVAHELNNPLQGIVTYSHLILENTDNDDPAKTSVEKIVGQAIRCRDIIRGLLDFSRQRKPDKILSNLNSVMDQCLSFVEDQALFHNIKITKSFQEDLPMIVIDPSQIERVIMNMIINAAEAMDKGGELILSTRLDLNSDFIELEFKDTGQGISEKDLEKIFDPFFTTKDVGHGTGLGLAISYGIVKSHFGTITVESKVGEGTTFLVRLPLQTVVEGQGNGRASKIINN
jgi:two-component system NtrC family sensor kinase